MELFADDWKKISRIRVEYPTWRDVEAAIRRLDGARFTSVCLMEAEAVGMHISGGCSRYMCERIGRGQTRVLIDPTKSMEDSVTIETGEAQDFPERWTVDLELALKAAKTFLDTGELDATLSWED